MGKVIKKVHSELKTIRDLIDSRDQFNIPRYQRLFVWEKPQVDTLLQDLLMAYKEKKELFYLGSILIVKQKENELIYDLIDGQQRFTVLWLLSLELKNGLNNFTTVNGELRLKFSIREDAKDYFESVLNKDRLKLDNFRSVNESLIKIDIARKQIINLIEHEFKNNSNEKARFANFIRLHVKLLVSEVPRDTDLNKMFEVINNRGQQLQQHEILKASLLSHFENKQERIRYGKIWNACSDMENYIEKSIQIEVGNNLANTYNSDSQKFSLREILNVMIAQRARVNKSMSLNEILDGKTIEIEDDESNNLSEYIEDSPESEDDELQNVRSILSFPQLLLHTLRIYLFINNLGDIDRINEKELLEIYKKHFKINDEKESKDFIHLLWEVRVCFDLFIIKWVKQNDGEEIHSIKQLEKYNQYRKWTYYLRRVTKENNHGFELLQSMLYHSQQITTHYWLTPLLYKCLKTKTTEELYSYLRKLDNVLFCSDKEDLLTLRTWNAMSLDIENQKNYYNCNMLTEDHGVQFPHYWFYKTEYILWYLLKGKTDSRLKDRGNLWKNFRLTAKNSVEHISPQNPNYKLDIISGAYMNKFGNLALVSRSLNSEFSNKPFREKRERFIYHNTSKLDSLKLALVYDNDGWNDILCKNHQNELINFFIEYFNKN